MRSTAIFLISCIVLLTFLTACGSPQKYMGTTDEQSQKWESTKAGIANPASTYCTEQGFSWSNRQDTEGNGYGICTFHDGSWCDEWAYYRGNCHQGINMTLCGKQFWGKTVCYENDPVCGFNNATDSWETFNSACHACISSDSLIGYNLGPCEDAS